MNIELHIERLILDGLPITTAAGEAVQAAIEAELVRNLASVAGRSSLPDGLALDRVTGEALHLTGREGPRDLGRLIAGSVQASLARSFLPPESHHLAPQLSPQFVPSSAVPMNYSLPERRS